MKQDKQDRRSQRTRQLLSSALMGLLSEKRYEAITVQDILDRAGIGRSTFYTHYFDKDDLHASMMEQMIERMNQQLFERHAGDGIVPSLELFQHIQHDFHQLLTVMGGPAGERLWEMARAALTRSVERALNAAREDAGPPAIALDVVSNYLAGAFLNLLKWWLKAGMPYSPEEMDRIFRQLALPGVWATLGTAVERSEPRAG